MSQNKNRYRNPWAKKLNVPKPEFYENSAPCVFNENGVQVFKLFDHGFDYVFEGCCFTQRAGFSPEVSRKVIADIFSGETCVCDDVAKHLRAHGKACMTYGEYNELFAQGKVA